MFNIIDPLPPITISVKDIMALDNLLAQKTASTIPEGITSYLERELYRAEVLSEKDIPQHFVRMHSVVTYSLNIYGEERRLTLVYPEEADINAGKISILTPIGAALIGMAAGNSITYYTPNGGAQTLTVISVSQQSDEYV